MAGLLRRDKMIARVKKTKSYQQNTNYVKKSFIALGTIKKTFIKITAGKQSRNQSYRELNRCKLRLVNIKCAFQTGLCLLGYAGERDI